MNLSTGVIIANVLCLTISFAAPLMLVALGGMFSERSGVINLALEGIMIIGALLSCLTLRMLNDVEVFPTIGDRITRTGVVQTGVTMSWGEANPQLAVLIAVAVAAISGAIFSLFLAFAAINLKADQTIGGTALNQFAPAFAVVLAWAIQGQSGTDIAIPSWVRITPQQLGIEGKVNTDFLPTLFKQFHLTTPIAIVLLVIVGIIKLMLTKLDMQRYNKLATRISLSISAISVLLFAVTRESYAVAVVFLLLVMKGILLLKCAKV